MLASCEVFNETTPLHYAKDSAIARFLVEGKKCDVNHRNKFNNTPLHGACSGGHIEIVEYLINKQGVNPSCEDDSGTTPLHYAKDSAIARFLVEGKKCDVNHRNKFNNTPSMVLLSMDDWM